MKIPEVVLNKLPKNDEYKKWLIISCILIFVGAFLSFYLVPQILKVCIEYLSVAKPGHFIRKKHESEQHLTHKLYLWNITNPNEVATGTEKPKMQEVGPYVFSHLKQKINPVDNKAEDTVSFNFWNIFHFNPQLSAPLTGNETVTLLNLILVAGMVKIKYESPHLLKIIAESFDDIFKKPTSIFVTMTVMEFVDTGFLIDCNEISYAVRVACAEMRRQRVLKSLNEDNTLLRYRWFDKLNDTIQPRYTVMRGSKNIYDLGRMTAVNNEPRLKTFKDEKCNALKGTDGMYFPPFQRKDDTIWTYSDDACKSLPLRYKYTKTLHGVVSTAYKYFSISDQLMMNPLCNCNRYIGCSESGTLDMYYCLGVFIGGSHPHFYLAEQSSRDTVEGMNPQEHLHDTGVYFDLLTGVPILAYERFQVNLLLQRIPEYHIFDSIAGDIWVPQFWYEENFTVGKSDLLLIMLSRILRFIGLAIGYASMTIGIVRCVVIAALRIHQHVTVIPEMSSAQPEQTTN